MDSIGFDPPFPMHGSFAALCLQAADRATKKRAAVGAEPVKPVAPPASLVNDITNMPWDAGFAEFFRPDTRKQDFPTIFFIGMAAMSIPMASVDPERYFSLLRYIKNRLRSTIGRLHLDCLMELFLNTDFVAELDKGTGPDATKLAGEQAEEWTTELIECSLKRWFRYNRRIDVQPEDEIRWRELGLYDDDVLPSEGGDAEPTFGISVARDAEALSKDLSPRRKGRIANAAKIEMHEAPAEPSELEARVHRDTDEWCFPSCGDMTVQPGDCVAVWWNDRAINTHSESGAVVPDEDYVPSPGWALGKTGFHALGAQCKDKCGSCTKCKRHDTWGVTHGSDSLKDDQPLKPATYGVEWVFVKEHILDPVAAAGGNGAGVTQ